MAGASDSTPSAEACSYSPRTGHDRTARVLALATELKAASAGCILDAELACTLPYGRCDFHAITSGARPGEDHRLSLWAFDLLHRCRDRRGEAFEDRHARLGDVLATWPVPCLHQVDCFADGAALLAACETQGHVGIVSKCGPGGTCRERARAGAT